MSNRSSVVAWLLPVTLSQVFNFGCESRKGHAEFWMNEREKIELVHKNELASYRIAQTPYERFEELERLTELLSENESALRKLRGKHASLTLEITRIETEIDALVQTAAQQQRARAQGMKFASLESRNGRVFEQVLVTGVDDAGVSIRHQNGSTRLRYADLTDEQRLFFVMDEASALAAEDAERRNSLAYELRIEKELGVIRLDQERRAVERKREESGRIASRVMASSMARKETSPLSRPATPFGRGSSYRRSPYYSVSRYYYPGQTYVYRPYVPPISVCAPQSYQRVPVRLDFPRHVSRQAVSPGFPCGPGPANTRPPDTNITP
jgi:hypothetical protein